MSGSWPTARLGDHITAKYGKALPQARRREGKVLVFGSNGAVGHHDEAITRGPAIIIGRKGSSGAVNYSATACWPIDTTYYIDDPGPFSLEFLDLLLRSLGLEELDRSTAIPGLSRDDLYAIEVPIPPLSDQLHLVELLNASRALAVSSGNHLSAGRRAIERFRQAVLAAACSGRLTADWRDSNDQPKSIEELLKEIDSCGTMRHRQPASSSQLDVPDSWAVVSLDRITSFVTSGSRGWGKFYSEDGPLFIRAQDIKTDSLELSHIAHVRPPLGAEGERTRVQRGDLLVTITGANVTKSAFVDCDITEAYVNQHVALARPVLPRLSEYLHLWTVSQQHGRRKLLADAYGAGRPGLNLDNLRTMPVGLPPLDEQSEIVRRVDRLLEPADVLCSRINNATRRIDRSSQAILAKAFGGDFVAAAQEEK